MGRKIFLALASLFFVITIHAQKEARVFEKVELEANTNEKAFAEHIMRKTQLPDSMLKDVPGGAYKVNVQFVIDTHGNIGQVKAKNDPGFNLAKRAENIISTYTGTWRPATQCGRKINAYRVQSVIFIIPSQ